jgi:hypothetical protein
MRPANLQTANQATAAHGNMNAMNRSPVNTPSNAARPNLGANPNTRMNGSQANMQAGSPAHGNFEAAQNGHAAAEPGNAHNQANQGVDARMNAPRMETPTSMGGHYVPRPPSAGGNPVTEARPGMNTGAMHGNANANVGSSNETAATNGANRNPAVGGTPHYGATSPSTPRPTQTYQPGHVNTPQYSVPSHQATPNYSAPKGNTPSGHGPTASAPRPPTGYTYRPAPTYSAPASNGANANRAYGASYGNNSPRSYSAPSYNAGRSTSPTPSYSAGRSASQPAYHTATPSYSSRSYGSSMPSYSSRSAGSYNAGRASMPSYSAPRSSGGGGGYHPSGGGSSFHGGGGGGGHSGGGGHGR